MALYDRIPYSDVDDAPRRLLVALEQLPTRRTVYTDPVRAARLIRTLVVTVVITTAATLAVVFGYDLLHFLGRAALLVVLVTLIGLAAALVVDTLRGPDA